MKDLVCVVADKQIAATLDELLLRRRALGIRPVEAEILVHPHHDPGCYTRPADLLRGYRQAAEHALIVLDHAWEGVPAASGAVLEALIDEKLEEAGMADWAVPVVIEPELEAWVFNASPHVADVLGWKPSWSPDHPRAAELFYPDRLPAFHDPFAGGEHCPLEAQRLGLEAYAGPSAKG